MEYVAKGEDIYATLSVSKTATADEIKKAYHVAALRYHPDRCSGGSAEERAQATKMFQKLGFVYSILSDPSKRKLYDEAGDLGSASEDLDMDSLQTWKKFFETVFKPVTKEVVKFFTFSAIFGLNAGLFLNFQELADFEKTYPGSPAELEDLKEAYTTGKGSMDHILDHVPLSSTKDEDRFRTIITGLFKKGDLKETELWAKTNTKLAQTRRKKKEQTQVAEFETKQKQSKAAVDTLEALRSAIVERKKSGFDDLCAALEAKYAGQGKKATGGEGKGKRDSAVSSTSQEKKAKRSKK